MNNTHPAALRTPDEARQWLKDNGLTIARFALDHGLSYIAVTEVLKGRNKGRFGAAHAAAVALGIKPPPRSPIPPAAPSPQP